MANDKIYPDSELISGLNSKDGIDEAVRVMYTNYFEMSRIYILNNKGQEADAEDIFQEVVVAFIDLVQKNKFRGESSIRTFLYSLIRYAWLNELKKRGRAQLRDEKFEKGKDEFDESAAGIMAKRESMNLLMQAVDQMGETCKKILLAFYFENMPMKEILQTLDYENEQVVRNKKYKCLKQLEQWIKDRPKLAQNLQSILSYE